jgi:hypothetical protein
MRIPPGPILARENVIEEHGSAIGCREYLQAIAVLPV